jgi:hypothetical protein
MSRLFSFTVTASGLPAWVPSQGTFADVSLNIPNDSGVKAVNVGQYSDEFPVAVWTAWTSGTFAPELGALGSYVCWGGGHTSYDGNEVYRWDVSTRLWSRMGEPSPYSSGSDSVNLLDANGAFPDGKPCAPHSYHTLGILPSSQGGGTYGSLIQAGLPAVTNLGASRMNRWWKFNFATAMGSSVGGAGWSTFPSAAAPLNGAAIPDDAAPYKIMVQEPQSDGGAFWYFGAGNSQFVTKVTQAGAVAFSRNVGFNSGDPCSGGVIPGTRCAIVHGSFSGIQTRLFNLATIEGGASSNVVLSTTGTPANGRDSLTWCPDRGAFATINHLSPTTVRWLIPSNPANPAASTWAWTSETFAPASGTTAAPGINGAYGRFVWVPAIKCFLWSSAITRKMQAYRPEI